MLEVCGSSLLWRFLPVGGVGQVACQGFLVREACVSVLVGGAGSLLSGVQLSVHGFGVTLDSLYFNAQGYVPTLLEN